MRNSSERKRRRLLKQRINNMPKKQNTFEQELAKHRKEVYESDVAHNKKIQKKINSTKNPIKKLWLYGQKITRGKMNEKMTRISLEQKKRKEYLNKQKQLDKFKKETKKKDTLQNKKIKLKIKKEEAKISKPEGWEKKYE